jgi:hypothetical protein
MVRYIKRARARNLISKAGLWFVDIPRTSSTSVKKVLGDTYKGEFRKTYERESGLRTRNKYFSDHTSARIIKKSLSPKIWDELFSFSIVRNPWDRFLSLYKFRQANGDLPKDVDFKAYVLSLNHTRYRDNNSPFCQPYYHMSMSDFLMDSSDNLLVKKIFLFEERSLLVKELNKRFNLNLKNVHKEKLSNGVTYRESYDDESSGIIQRFYADDIENINYQF